MLPEREDVPHRYARHYGWAFEDMRAEPAERPVFLATMGPIAAHTARATFATNLFAAGGVAVEAAGATADVDGGARRPTPASPSCASRAPTRRTPSGAPTSWRRCARQGRRTSSWPASRGSGPSTDVDDSCAMGVDALGFLGRIREELAR